MLNQNLIVSWFENVTVEDVKKYNGKDVSIQSLVEIFFQKHNFVIFFKFPASSASNQYKLRALLKTKAIGLRYLKKKDLLVGLRFYKDVGRVPLKDEFFQSIKVSGYFIMFEDYNQFIYFENFLLLKFFGQKFFPIFFKTNNQFFFYNSLHYKQLRSKLAIFKHNFSNILGFFPFFYKFHVCYMLFVLFLRTQNLFFKIS